MTVFPFIKMNGAGNDFVVFDARQAALALSPGQLRRIADRANPVTRGCDQIIVMEQVSGVRNQVSEKEADNPSDTRHLTPDIFMRIYNADSSEVDACGNATRCIAWLVMQEKESRSVVVETRAGMQRCAPAGAMQVVTDMGPPRFKWNEIPLSMPCGDPLQVDIAVSGLHDAACVGMGNPHVIFFTPDAAIFSIIDQLGPLMQQHPLFRTHGVNVSIAHVRDASHVDAKVWERGVGLTQACGTAACATAVAAIERGWCRHGDYITIMQGGDMLRVRWDAGGHVFLTGPVELEFEGMVELT